MLTLFINTVGEKNQVVLFQKEKSLARATWNAQKNTGKKLIPQINNVLRRAKRKLCECENIAVATGPGGFSGVRVGVTTANILGLILGVPVQAVEKNNTPDFRHRAKTTFVTPFYSSPPNITKPKNHHA